MTNPFELLDAAEEHANHAGQLLDRLKQMKIEGAEAARLESAIEKGAKIHTAILDQKAILLRMLIKIAFVLADKTYLGPFPGICHYVLSRPNEIEVVLNHPGGERRSSDHLLGHYTPERFVRTENLWWRDFCEAIIKRLEWHVLHDAAVNSTLTDELERVRSRFRTLTA